MTLVIATTPDPVYLEPFVLRLLGAYADRYDITVIRATGSSITRKRSISKTLTYLLALIVILGPLATLRNAWVLLRSKLRRVSPIERFCSARSIEQREFSSLNSPEAREFLSTLQPDLIFNQSNHTLRGELLAIPTIATFNRHGAPLPDYRGRLAPFWQLYRGEQEAGLTYHVVTEAIDAGDIILQETWDITDRPSVPRLIDEMFDRAVARFPEAVERLQAWDRDEIELTPNRTTLGSSFPSPTLRDALRYRLRRPYDRA